MITDNEVIKKSKSTKAGNKKYTSIATILKIEKDDDTAYSSLHLKETGESCLRVYSPETTMMSWTVYDEDSFELLIYETLNGNHEVPLLGSFYFQGRWIKVENAWNVDERILIKKTFKEREEFEKLPTKILPTPFGGEEICLTLEERDTAYYSLHFDKGDCYLRLRTTEITQVFSDESEIDGIRVASSLSINGKIAVNISWRVKEEEYPGSFPSEGKFSLKESAKRLNFKGNWIMLEDAWEDRLIEYNQQISGQQGFESEVTSADEIA